MLFSTNIRKQHRGRARTVQITGETGEGVHFEMTTEKTLICSKLIGTQITVIRNQRVFLPAARKCSPWRFKWAVSLRADILAGVAAGLQPREDRVTGQQPGARVRDPLSAEKWLWEAVLLGPCRIPPPHSGLAICSGPGSGKSCHHSWPHGS